MGGCFRGKFYHERRGFYQGTLGFSSIYLKKNNEKINEIKFIQVELRSSIKT